MSSQSKRWLQIMMGKGGEDGNLLIHTDKAEGGSRASACSRAKAQANRYQLPRPVETAGRGGGGPRRPCRGPSQISGRLPKAGLRPDVPNTCKLLWHQTSVKGLLQTWFPSTSSRLLPFDTVVQTLHCHYLYYITSVASYIFVIYCIYIRLLVFHFFLR